MVLMSTSLAASSPSALLNESRSSFTWCRAAARGGGRLGFNESCNSYIWCRTSRQRGQWG